ncbi:hypothetical protein GPECTOR_143g713 [Gonium pectorale]|uniref:Uncharacterized protein n=1 Tax=Gonium pectorale TaxID=33097 RepID=A0A150FXX9_GONPE|nr:hypothetical protein GPECTOR_143g713 [Gonium pectorale]|eukprot:KXZ42472.1 hypothetical protein GPECTOR_143g713 [Gonium pectorale]
MRENYPGEYGDVAATCARLAAASGSGGGGADSGAESDVLLVPDVGTAAGAPSGLSGGGFAGGLPGAAWLAERLP